MLFLGEADLVSQDTRRIRRRGVLYEVDVDSKDKQECKQTEMLLAES